MDNNYWVRRQSRRRFLGSAAGVSAAAVAFATTGCGDDDDDDSSSGSPTAAGATTAASVTAGPTKAATPAAKSGGTARFVSSNATYDTFDHSRSRFSPVATIVGLTMQRVLQWDSFANGTLGGAFAESWEQPDAQTVKLKLRPNNFFHNKPPVNGRQTKAEDIKFHIERNKSGKLLDGTDDPNFYRKGEYQVVESVSVPDASTVLVKLAKPSPLFLNLLAQSYEGIGAPEAIQQFEKSYANFNQEMIIGSGPFVLTEFSSEGRLKFKKYDKSSRPVNLDGVQYVPLFTDTAAQQAAWEQKQIDGYGPSTIQVLEELRSRQRDHEVRLKNLHHDEQALQTLLEQRPLLQLLFNAGIFVTGTDGTAIASLPTSTQRIGVNYRDRDFMAAALEEGKASIGRPVIGRRLKSPIFVMAVPLRDSQGKVTGVLAGWRYPFAIPKVKSPASWLG